jgi:hypothetical protein
MDELNNSFGITACYPTLSYYKIKNLFIKKRLDKIFDISALNHQYRDIPLHNSSSCTGFFHLTFSSIILENNVYYSEKLAMKNRGAR